MIAHMANAWKKSKAQQNNAIAEAIKSANLPIDSTTRNALEAGKEGAEK